MQDDESTHPIADQLIRTTETWNDNDNDKDNDNDNDNDNDKDMWRFILPWRRSKLELVLSYNNGFATKKLFVILTFYAVWTFLSILVI